MTSKATTMKVSFGGLQLDLRLGARDIVRVERRLNESMVNMFVSSEGGMKLPPANKLLIVLQEANQTHGVSDEDLINAFDKFLNAGKTPMDLMKIVQDLLDQAGFLGSKTSETKTEKVSGNVVSLDAPTEPTDDLD